MRVFAGRSPQQHMCVGNTINYLLQIEREEKVEEVREGVREKLEWRRLREGGRERIGFRE